MTMENVVKLLVVRLSVQTEEGVETFSAPTYIEAKERNGIWTHVSFSPFERELHGFVDVDCLRLLRDGDNYRVI